jgi:hypothetical protein
MCRIEITIEEQQVLEDVLRNALTTLEQEIHHTDHADYKHQLKHRREIIERIHDRLPQVLVTA